jgi:hypothetical protein
MLSVIIRSVIMPDGKCQVLLSQIPSFLMLSVIIPSVIMPDGKMPSVAKPNAKISYAECHTKGCYAR